MRKNKIVSVDELSAEINLSDRRIQQLVKAKVFKKESRGKYDLLDCSIKLIKVYQEKNSGKDAETKDSKKNRARLLNAQADEKEIEVAIKKAEFLPIEIFQNTVNELVAICAMGLEAIPGRMANELAGISEPAEVQQQLLEEIRNIRGSLSESLSKFGKGFVENPPDSGGDDERSATKKPRRVGGKKHASTKGKRGAGENKAK